ncbi:MAG: presenilin family intramembrane aspartyl protease [Candidatus Micrarchaeota archaeon]|nr:presenilin family intramembrane aspartyl protease [Candidatus Micrarchaeota archaeon]
MNHIARIVAMFLIAQLIGLFVGIQLVGNPVYGDLNVTPNQQPGDTGNSFLFILYVILVAVIVVLVIKYFKWSHSLFRLFEVVMIFGTSSIVFFIFLTYFGVPYSMEITVVLSLLLVLLKVKRPEFRNVAAIISSAAAGALFGFSFDMIPALIFIVFASLYDFVSVFVTKHMIYMAKEMSKMELSFTISSREKRYVKEHKKEEEFSVELGSGDIALPLMLAVSAYRFDFSVIDAFAVVFGATVGLVIVLYYVTKNKVFLPALPPLCFFGVLSFGLSRLLLH